MATARSYTLEKTRKSLVGAAILSGVFTLDLFVHLWTKIPFGFLLGAMWGVVTLIGSAVGSYRGAIKLDLNKPLIVVLTLVSFIPPVGFLIHLVLLARLPRNDA
jgi:hypothetical protein